MELDAERVVDEMWKICERINKVADLQLREMWTIELALAGKRRSSESRMELQYFFTLELSLSRSASCRSD